MPLTIGFNSPTAPYFFRPGPHEKALVGKRRHGSACQHFSCKECELKPLGKKCFDDFIQLRYSTSLSGAQTGQTYCRLVTNQSHTMPQVQGQGDPRMLQDGFISTAIATPWAKLLPVSIFVGALSRAHGASFQSAGLGYEWHSQPVYIPFKRFQESFQGGAQAKRFKIRDMTFRSRRLSWTNSAAKAFLSCFSWTCIARMVM